MDEITTIITVLVIGLICLIGLTVGEPALGEKIAISGVSGLVGFLSRKSGIIPK